MSEYLLIVIFVAWYVLALAVSETIGKKSKLGIQWSFFISIMLSPLVGYIATKFSSK